VTETDPEGGPRCQKCRSLNRFPVCKLIDKLDSDWRNDHSLPVQVARAQIAALRNAGDPTGRYRAKWQLVRNLVRSRVECGRSARDLPADRLDDELAGGFEPEIRRRTGRFGGEFEHALGWETETPSLARLETVGNGDAQLGTAGNRETLRLWE